MTEATPTSSATRRSTLWHVELTLHLSGHALSLSLLDRGGALGAGFLVSLSLLGLGHAIGLLRARLETK